MNKLTNSFLWPTFIIGDRIAKHFAEDGLGKSVEVAELGVFLVDDAIEKVQLRDYSLLLHDGRNRNGNRNKCGFYKMLYCHTLSISPIKNTCLLQIHKVIQDETGINTFDKTNSMERILVVNWLLIIPNCCASNIAALADNKISFADSVSVILIILKAHFLEF